MKHILIVMLFVAGMAYAGEKGGENGKHTVKDLIALTEEMQEKFYHTENSQEELEEYKQGLASKFAKGNELSGKIAFAQVRPAKGLYTAVFRYEKILKEKDGEHDEIKAVINIQVKGLSMEEAGKMKKSGTVSGLIEWFGVKGTGQLDDRQIDVIMNKK
ncbi:MAG: hypothetical protein JXR97_15970 [Planctomycetes bacterium]|nr:hypothetical protein [Planctomycetota bacterium]